MMTISEVRDALKRPGVHITKLSKKAGVTRQTLYNVINGAQVYSDILERISGALEEEGAKDEATR